MWGVPSVINEEHLSVAIRDTAVDDLEGYSTSGNPSEKRKVLIGKRFQHK
jgi:hypothetical protein